MTVHIAGKLWDFNTPQIMGILNVTPDSFYADSRTKDEAAICARAEQIVREGAWMIDVGAYSTRPGAIEVSEEEELRRLDLALSAVRKSLPEALVSVDTFRASVARHCVESYGVALINDISGGADPQMFVTVADLRVPYVLTHPGCGEGVAPDDFRPSVARFLAERLGELYDLGVADVILDLGFGFGKTVAENYELIRHLGDFVSLFPDNPMLAGVSRKSMIYKTLDTTPDKALHGTTALHALALQAGAAILRVHDVQVAADTIKVCQAVNFEH